jgi:hypothetical protein
VEGSVAAAPAGDATTQAQQQQADGSESQSQQQQQAEPTLADIHSTLQQFGSDVESMRDHLATEPWKATDGQEGQQQQQQTAPEDLDFSFLDENAPTYQGPEAAMQQLGDLIRGEAQKIATEQVAPLKQEMQQERHDRQFEALSDRYPQLQDKAVAQELLNVTAQIVEQEGFPKELALHPGFVERIYLASRAQDQNQGGGDAAAATLEGAGGASPGGAGQGAEQPTAADWAAGVAPKRLGLFTGG